MLKDPSKKYRPLPPVALPDRQWPNRVITQAPRWCSVDLRDGNQALAVPMNVGQKLELFSTLVKIGFKEIEVGFPSASNTEFTFNRRLIEEKRAPDDVWLQVLVQAREDLIERTVEWLKEHLDDPAAGLDPEDRELQKMIAALVARADPDLFSTRARRPR